MSQTPTEVEQLMREALTVTNGREFSRIPNVIAESYVGHQPGDADDIHGQDGMEAWLREFDAGFPDFEMIVEAELVGDDVVMEEWTLTGTHEGEYNGIPPTHREVELRGMSKFVIEDGRIAEEYMYFNVQDFYDQLGVTDG